MKTTTDTTDATKQYMLAKFGPVMTLDDLAAVLDRSVGGIRLGLRTDAPWAQQLRQARRKVGKRVYFVTAGVAAFLSDEQN